MRAVQSVASIACRELGFDRGVFQNVDSVPADAPLPPAWLGRIPCVGIEPTLVDCGLEYGNTASCGLTQRILCSSGPGASSPCV